MKMKMKLNLVVVENNMKFEVYIKACREPRKLQVIVDNMDEVKKRWKCWKLIMTIILDMKFII